MYATYAPRIYLVVAAVVLASAIASTSQAQPVADIAPHAIGACLHFGS
ncbi:MAG: hypothetical protein QGF53_12315 [Alphaproteobacteria bacterium]|jgi:hypothetical protein|nr:hypothetical protein [Alphaproteobacteria bacterium]